MVSRKRWFPRLLVFVVLVALVASGCTGAPKQEKGESTPAATPPQPAKTLHILTLNWPQAAVEQEFADKYFTPKTGIKVVIEAQPYSFAEAKAKQELAAKSPYYDILDYDSQWIGGYVAANGLERLDTPQYLNAPDSPIKADDFIPEVALDLMRYPSLFDDLFVTHNLDKYKNAPVYGLPWSINAQILVYRKDLISNPPKTWDEYKALAKKFNDPPKMYGTVFSASRQSDYVSMDFFPMLWGWGANIWDEKNWKAEGYVNSPQAIEAMKFFASFYKDGLVPPDTPNYAMDEKVTAITQGKVALAEEWNLMGSVLEDPKISVVSGKLGYAVTPAGPQGQYSMYGCQGTGINAFSKQKKEAWDYLKWFTSKETQERLLNDPRAAFASARKDLVEANRKSSPWNAAFMDSIPYMRDFFNITPYSEFLDVLQSEENLGFSGRKSPEKAMNDAAIEAQAILDSNIKLKVAQ